MARTFGPRYYAPEEIQFKKHWAAGVQYEIAGSGDNQYTVEFTERGFTCDCIGMKMHGKCKHTRMIAEKWLTSAEN